MNTIHFIIIPRDKNIIWTLSKLGQPPKLIKFKINKVQLVVIC